MINIYGELGYSSSVSFRIVFENLADGMTLDEILDSYPTLTREAALLTLKEAEASFEREQASA